MTSGPTTPRTLADDYVSALADLDPLVSSGLGLREHEDRLPDHSPDGARARRDLAARTLAALDALERDAAGGPALTDPVEARCARLLRDRLGVEVEAYERGEHLRTVRNIFGPPQAVRGAFSLMPTATDDDWAAIGRRLHALPASYASWSRALDAGVAQGLTAAPLQVETVVGQLDAWLGSGRSWFHDLVADGPEAQRAELDAAADAAAAGVADLRAHLAGSYLPAAAGTPDAVGEDRYVFSARRVAGATIDPAATYAWGWEEYRRIQAEMVDLADRILPGATPLAAMRHLDEHGTVVEGVEEVRVWLQQMMDRAITDLDGTHFDIAEPIRNVEAMIAPPGSAAAPYYTRPSLGFVRPGRTWLPTLGRTRFPVYDLISTWYHEGVPGHHLQLAQWVHVAPSLSTFQTSVGSSSGTTEGWALYAERLVDELGYLDDEARIGYLDAQLLRAVRVVVDIGMHLGLRVPDDSPIAPGEVWTRELAERFLGAHTGSPADFVTSEVVRYLGWPGQAISYKLGERAWLEGRERARARHGEAFDLKAWHMAALSLGALGLDDLTDELAAL
ncbi:DUF885 domain-containing protein [Nocardioides zeae]|uniref:DUF885 domain-containing protein n=1 Tax=Nocardioides imazamoxiresistens TaxID=3231893 RepID=A0ABU3PZ65_9ACTN|nr:DUF885 domain-containing protein [Nocardioides zeae]MDT9594466.1 DUF885 domain-containing protein [Nocardioides zeae]